MNSHVAQPFRSILRGIEPVTDFRVDAAELAASDYRRLPAAVRRLIEAYATNLVEHDGRVTFQIAIGRWMEIAQAERAGRGGEK